MVRRIQKSERRVSACSAIVPAAALMLPISGSIALRCRRSAKSFVVSPRWAPLIGTAGFIDAMATVAAIDHSKIRTLFSQDFDLIQRWSQEFGPVVKMDFLMSEMIHNDEEKKPRARIQSQGCA